VEPNGLAVDAAGRLVVCDFGAGRLVRFDPATGRTETLLDEVDGRPLTHPNFVAFDRDGLLWCTNSTDRDDLFDAVNEPADDGFLAVIAPDGCASIACAGLRFPNGCAVSPDGRTLVVVESGARQVWRAPLTGRGRTGAPSPFGPVLHAVPDGVAFDVDGGLWVTLVFPRSGIVRIGADGRVETVVDGDVGLPTNLAFGGRRMNTIYVGSLDLDQITVLESDRAGAALAGRG
jgi:gluconolactonase